MSTEHTSGRLHVAGQEGLQIRSEKHQIAKAWAFAGKTGQSNARRLVACWNACDGLSTESLERLGTLDRASIALDVQRRVQRDELLKALKALHTRYVQCIGNEGPEALAARVAIAKAEGTSDASS